MDAFTSHRFALTEKHAVVSYNSRKNFLLRSMDAENAANMGILTLVFRKVGRIQIPLTVGGGK